MHIDTTELNNLEMFKTVFITTPVGIIEVIKGYDGCEAWIRSDNVPAHAVGVRASSPLRAFEHQLAVGAAYAPESDGEILEPVETQTAAEEAADILQTAFRQTYASEILFADDERASAKIHNSFLKAITEIERNKTIEFEQGVLTFVSRFSRKGYIITRDGCSTNCEAFEKRTFCYHRAVYSILFNYSTLKPDNLIEAQNRFGGSCNSQNRQLRSAA